MDPSSRPCLVWLLERALQDLVSPLLAVCKGVEGVYLTTSAACQGITQVRRVCIW